MDIKHIRSVKNIHTTEEYSVGDYITLSMTTSNCDDKVVAALSGCHPSLPEKCRPAVIKPDFFDLIKHKNPFAEDWDAFFVKSCKLSNIDWSTLDENQIVWAYYDGHEIFNKDGQIIPLIKKYDYTCSPFSNEYCNLKDLMQYLKNHPWVINPSDIEIQRIPSYNASHGRDKYISVSLLPDQDSYNKMYLEAKDNPYWSVRLKEIICGYNILFNKDGKDYLGIRPYLKKDK